MKHPRRSRLLLVATAFPLLFGCVRPQATAHEAGADTSGVLRNAADVPAIAAAYHERVRLGLGSPFRIIEIAARDERLPLAEREQLLHDLFARVESGDMYHVARVLPQAHQILVEHAIASTDPRIGELAVNLAYQLATTEKSISASLLERVSASAALLRDRQLAMHDAQRVRQEARAHNQHAHTLVPALRETRALLVEQPLILRMDAVAQEEAARLAMLMIGGVRQAARTDAGSYVQPVRHERLPRDVAERIIRLQRPDARPPQGAVFIASGAHDEEVLVADSALTLEQVLHVAVALRPFAQEAIWYAGRAEPSHAELLARFGVRVAFDPAVPAGWHGYYRALLADALDDVMLVLPGMTLKGLTIEVGEVKEGAAHLAYHDPKARLIRWAPSTGSGSLAHEIGHDVDWQIARRAYGRKAGYASEYAADVSAAMLLTNPDSSGAVRPTETFARQLDWLLAARLAEFGRINGHLSSVQHEWLRGHGQALPAAANSRSANALAGLIARAGKLTEAGRAGVERTVLATELPVAVRAVRELRFGAASELARGPRAAPWTAVLPQSATFVDMLAAAAGTSIRTGGLSPELVLTFTNP